MSQKIPYAVKIGADTVRRVREYCARKGLKQGHFVAEALQEKIGREEELEDVRDLAALRGQESKATSYRDYIRKSRK